MRVEACLEIDGWMVSARYSAGPIFLSSGDRGEGGVGGEAERGGVTGSLYGKSGEAPEKKIL